MLFADLGEQEPSQTSSWNEHVQRLQGMIPKLYDCSHDGRMTREGLQGEYADQGVVMQQLNKQMKDAEKPQWQLHVDPFYRYEQFAKKLEERYRGARILENMHPVVRRTLALRKPDGDRSEVMLQRTLLKIDGKNIETRSAAFDFVPPPQAAEVLLPTPGDRKRAIPEPEVARRASCKSESLQAMLSKQIDEHVQRSSSSTRLWWWTLGTHLTQQGFCWVGWDTMGHHDRKAFEPRTESWADTCSKYDHLFEAANFKS